MHEVIVVGAGPAGAAAASLLGRAGRDVLLVDQNIFPRNKSCGDGISSRAVAELKYLNVWLKVKEAGFRPIEQIQCIGSNGKSITLKVLGTSEIQNLIAPRWEFDSILQRHAIESSASFRVLHVIAPLIEQGIVRGVVARGEGGLIEIRSRLVIAANGAASTLANKFLGIRRSTYHQGIAIRGYVSGDLRGDYSIRALFSSNLLPGYAWYFPVNDHLANVGLGTTSQQYRKLGKPLQTVLLEFLQKLSELGLYASKSRVEQVASWTLNTSCDNLPRGYPGMLVAGDAGGFTNPATGEGIANALTTGRMAAESAIAFLSKGMKLDALCHTYNSMWRSSLFASQRNACLFQKFLGNRDYLVNGFIELSCRFPTAFAFISRKLAHFLE